MIFSRHVQPSAIKGLAQAPLFKSDGEFQDGDGSPINQAWSSSEHGARVAARVTRA